MAWQKTSWTDAALLAAYADPDSEVSDLAHGRAPHDWYAELVAANQTSDAISLLAHALPRYDCVVWALRCLLELKAIERPDPLTLAVLRWIDQPNDTLRREVQELGDGLKPASPAALLAQAVFFSGGSIAPADLPPIQPPPEACSRMAAGAILIAAAAQPDHTAACKRAMSLGESIIAER